MTETGPLNYVYCIEERKQPIELPQLGIRCDEREIPHPLVGDANDYFVGMTQVMHSRPALDRSGEPTVVHEELKGLFGACVFGRKLAVIVRAGLDALPSCWFVLDLASVDVSPGVWVAGAFKNPPGSLIIEADDMTMKIVEPTRYLVDGPSQRQQAPVMIDALRHPGNHGLRLAPLDGETIPLLMQSGNLN